MTDHPKSFVERIANGLGSSVNSKIIFADPIEKDGVTIIPVSKVRYGFGAGIKHKSNSEAKSDRGAGGGVDAQPVGYIEIKNNNVRFHPIRTPISLPAIIIASGLASLLILRGIRKLFRR